VNAMSAVPGQGHEIVGGALEQETVGPRRTARTRPFTVRALHPPTPVRTWR
jgi:hypothetical protein